VGWVLPPLPRLRRKDLLPRIPAAQNGTSKTRRGGDLLSSTPTQPKDSKGVPPQISQILESPLLAQNSFG
jgi:hypothetical protein